MRSTRSVGCFYHVLGSVRVGDSKEECGCEVDSRRDRSQRRFVWLTDSQRATDIRSRCSDVAYRYRFSNSLPMLNTVLDMPEAKLTSLLLVEAKLLPVLPLKLFQLTEDAVLLLLGKRLPAGLDVGDDVVELDLVGALDEGACVASSLERPSLFLGDHGSLAKQGGSAEAASGSASDVLADHCVRNAAAC